MKCRLVVRGFAGRQVVFEEHIEIGPDQVGTVIPTIAERHARQMAAHELHMIEIEFLDEPNEKERFFRFGTDPSGMVAPIRISLNPNSTEN